MKESRRRFANHLVEYLVPSPCFWYGNCSSFKSVSLEMPSLGFMRLPNCIPFYSQGFVTLRPDLSVMHCSLAKLIFHLSCESTQPAFRLIVTFSVIVKVFVIGRIWSRWAWLLLSIKTIGVRYVRLTPRSQKQDHHERP